MAKISSYLQSVDFQDKSFIGTIAFRNEEITLPDGSKSALGIDGSHWVLVHQPSGGAPFQVFEYDQRSDKILVDKKPGSKTELQQFKKLVNYLFQHAETEDLVTILPPKVFKEEI